MGQDGRVCTILIATITFCIGIVVSKLVSFGFSYQNSISFADIANILVTTVVTIFAAWYLSKRLNEDRFSKEMAISDLKDIEQIVSDIIIKAQLEDPILNAEILKLVNHLQVLLSRFDRTCKLKRKQESIISIQNNFISLYRFATDFDTGPLDIQAIIKYGTDLIVEIRDTINSINKL